MQSKAIAAGLPADVVNFSIATDMDRLVQAGLVDESWASNPYHGIVSRSVVVFVLRNGNPKHLRTWDDLVKPGVQVVFPNPFSSGGARWDVMAAYGAMLREKKTPKQAQAYLTKLFQHNVSQDTSARNALNTFLSGKGDVLLDYESDAKLAQSQGKAVYYLIPKATLQIETPLAAVNGEQQGGGAAVRQLAVHAGGADDLGAERLPLGRAERREEVPRAVPAAAAAVHDRVRRRLGQGEHAVLRPDERDRREDRAESGAIHWLTSSHGCRGRGDALSALRR